MKAPFKFALYAVATVVAGTLCTVVGASLAADARLARVHPVHRMQLPPPAPADAAGVERGKHLVTSRFGCYSCHGANMAGGTMFDEPLVGRVLGPNLTLGKGSRTARYTFADWDRIVRHGVLPDGRGTLMNSESYFDMSDAELLDIVAYIRSLPPVDTDNTTMKLTVIGKILIAMGKLQIAAERQPTLPHRETPPAAVESVDFGRHLATACISCHRENFAGGPMPFSAPGWPAAANLTPHSSGLGNWSYEDFERALSQGTSRDGHPLREPMAAVVTGTSGMLPTEKRALWTYLRSLAPAPIGKT